MGNSALVGILVPRVYKILLRAEWADACASGCYQGSADDRRDGFIHLSARDQLEGTARHHFAGREDLVLVAFDAASLGSALKWEPSRSGALFPHLYGELPPALALWVRPLSLGADGVPALTGDLLRC